MVTKVDHIELVVHRFDKYAALFQALGFRELTRTKHHGDSIEFKLPGENQPIFEIHRVSGEENIGVNHIAFQVPDVSSEARSRGKREVTEQKRSPVQDDPPDRVPGPELRETVARADGLDLAPHL